MQKFQQRLNNSSKQIKEDFIEDSFLNEQTYNYLISPKDVSIVDSNLPPMSKSDGHVAANTTSRWLYDIKSREELPFSPPIAFHENMR